MAWSLWREQPTQLKSEDHDAKQIGFALSVSLLNPHAIMDTIGVIGTSATIYEGEIKSSSPFQQLLCHGCGLSFSSVWPYARIIDKTGKYILILNKFSSIIVLIVSAIILKNIIDLIF